MIENPKNLTEQILNLVERIATEIKAMYNKINKAVYTVNNIEPDAKGNIDIVSNSVHVGSDEPTEEDTSLWIDPDDSSVDVYDFGSTTSTENRLLLKRGSTTDVKSYAGKVGELVIDTTTNTLVVQNGTAGGIPLASKKELENLNVGVLTINNNSPDINGNIITHKLRVF